MKRPSLQHRSANAVDNYFKNEDMFQQAVLPSLQHVGLGTPAERELGLSPAKAKAAMQEMIQALEHVNQLRERLIRRHQQLLQPTAMEIAWKQADEETLRVLGARDDEIEMYSQAVFGHPPKQDGVEQVFNDMTERTGKPLQELMRMIFEGRRRAADGAGAARQGQQ